MNIARTEPYEPMSAQDFAAFGLHEVAYVKRVEDEDETGYAIHAADGTRLSLMEDRDVAMATIRRNDMEPLSAH
ncbi:MAG: DUF1150 family protein [Alphaproteobacteria bacterium]|jgi:hypothetical protein|nr:DUF1150 family protein [Alphaproteobacteria bacterium]